MQEREYLRIVALRISEKRHVWPDSVEVLYQVSDVEYRKYLTKLESEGWEMIGQHTKNRIEVSTLKRPIQK